jgi:outer membrane receptor protein involved in Fe transport
MKVSIPHIRVVLIVVVVTLLPLALFGQSTQTGAVTGTVTTNDNTPIPGVMVTVSSPVLQGTRTAYTEDNGSFLVRGLPPGSYTVSFSMEGLGGVRRSMAVELGQTSKLEVRMSPAATSEAITVTAEAPTALTTTQLGQNMSREEIQTLPIPRTGGGGLLANIAALTPGVTQNTFNAGQVRINGGFGYDNVFLVDGTDINDNLFGTAHNLYIEDAIQETQVLTGGVSAEYGRFTGGVVNVVTRSGGNEFSGTARADMTNPAWRDETPIEDERGVKRTDKTSPIYSATLGGPLMRDHLWFFGAYRRDYSTDSRTLPITSIPYDFQLQNPRGEVKLTGTVGNHTLQGSYLDNETTQVNNIGLANRTMDPRAFVTRTLPNTRKAVFYNGVLTANLFAEVKYAEKTFGFRNTGGTSLDILDSPFLTRSHSPSRHFNAPFFDSTDPEDRNNKDFTATGSYFLGTRNLGSHDLKSGYERYISTRVGGNSQSSTGYVFNADYKIDAAGQPIRDANSRFIPVFKPFGPGVSGFTTLVNWLPVRGAKVDLNNQAFFVQDTWTINTRFTLNAGLRYETVDGEATGNITTVSTSRITPRLALSIDPLANGRYKVDLTYAQYGGKYSEAQYARNTNVGTPNNVSYRYIGPAGEGIGFAPGFDLKNYEITSGSFPLQNVRVDPDIKAPVADEFTVSGGAAITRNGFVKVSYTNRQWTDFFEDFIDRSTGFTNVVISPTISRNLDNTYYSNTSDMTREYESVQLLSQFKPLRAWTIHANYTYEIKNDGNFVGEAGNQPGIATLFGDYPEIFDPQRSFPEGRLPGYQEHRLRLMNNYTLGMGRAGKVDFGLIYNYDSPTTFSYTATGVPYSAAQNAAYAAAGYKNTLTTQTLFFGERGEGKYNSSRSFDLATNYAVPIFRGVSPWIRFEMYNITNEKALRTFDTTISADNSSPKDALGLPTGYTKGAAFGTARNSDDYQIPREYRLSAGIRF